jgi:chromosome segregation ATPase
MSELFDNEIPSSIGKGNKEARTLEQLKNLDGKIVEAIVKVKSLKEDKARLEARVKELESEANEKDLEIKKLSEEKLDVRGQIEDLLGELESIESE